MKLSTKGFDKIKVGDLVAPVRVQYGKTESSTWTGVLREVQRVGEKRFSLSRTGMDDWIDKSSGRAVGGRGCYVMATPEMVAEVERKRQERAELERKQQTFRSHPAYGYAYAIMHLIEGMDYDNHPLNRLTVEEWAAFQAKLCGTP